MERHTLILVTLVAYQMALVLIGVWAVRRNRSNDDYFLGGRALGAIVASISYAATASSAWTLIGYTGAVYALGLPAFWFVPCIVFGHFISWTWVAPRFMRLSREKNLLTLTDLLVGDAKGAVRHATVLAVSLFILFCFSFYVAAQFDAAGTAFAANFNVSYRNSVFLGAGVVLIYTFLGGFWAVSVTDTLQGLVMVAVAILLPVACLAAVGGPAGLLAELEGRLAAPQLALFGTDTGLFVAFFMGVLGLGIGCLGQPQLLTRFMALRDEKALRQGRVIALTWFSFVFLGMFVVGLSGRVLIGEIDNQERLFFALSDALLPTLLGGIVTVAVLSAIMSTADSQLLVAASAVAHDLGFERRLGLSPILISRAVVTILCAVSVWITLAVPATIFARVLFAWSALGNAFGPTVIARALGVDTRPGAIFIAIVLGFVLTVSVNLYYQTGGGELTAFLPAEMGAVLERIVPFVLGLFIVFRFRREPARVAAPAE